MPRIVKVTVNMRVSDIIELTNSFVSHGSDAGTMVGIFRSAGC